jgi:hypothetical protein
MLVGLEQSDQRATLGRLNQSAEPVCLHRIRARQTLSSDGRAKTRRGNLRDLVFV